MPITQPLAHLHSSVFVTFLFLWECCLLLCCWLAQLLRWLVICVFSVACDFVSRLGGRDTICFSKDGWLKPSLEVLVFEAAVLKLRHGYSLLLSWRMLAGSATHVVGFRPRSGHLQATSCMRWQFYADYTTIGLPALVGFRCIPLPLGISPVLMLVACTTLKMVGDLCLPCSL